VRRKLIAVVETTLARFGSVRRREWGDLVSIELKAGGKKVFSFQVAERSAQLQPSVAVSWVDTPVDDIHATCQAGLATPETCWALWVKSLADLLASKMVALVERGAPRDFRRQELTGSDADGNRARLAIETHLARIQQHRPLSQITDDERRAAADQLRRWFKEVFFDALLD